MLSAYGELHFEGFLRTSTTWIKLRAIAYTPGDQRVSECLKSKINRRVVLPVASLVKCEGSVLNGMVMCPC